MITENLSTLKIHKLTQEQYNRELANNTLDKNAIYLTPEEEIDLSGYATTEQLNGKANSEHTHTVSEITDLQSSLDETLESAKSYANEQISTIPSVDAYTKEEINNTVAEINESINIAVSNLASTSSVDTSISTHNISTSAHEDIRALISDLSEEVNNLLDIDGVTTEELSEVINLIKDNEGTLESLTTSKVNVSDIVNNLTTNSTDKVLSAAQGVVLKGLIDALQSELDSHSHTIIAKASDDDIVILTGTNGTNGVAYSASHATSGVAAGTYKSVTVNETGHIISGTNPTTIAEYGITDAYTKTEIDNTISDLDTELNKHINNKNNPHEVTLEQLEVTATATELNVLDGIAVTTTELNYIDGVTSNIQTQLNGKVSNATTVNGKALSSNITLSYSDVGADANGSASNALSSANDYTDAAIETVNEILGDKMDCEDPACTGSFSMNRRLDSVTGDYSHAEGSDTEASGYCSHAEGGFTVASGDCSHAEGQDTEASDFCSHAEGYNTEAYGECSHAEGQDTVAFGIYSHAEGYNTEASGHCSHAEGSDTVASGSYSHAEGYNTVTLDFQHVQGHYNDTTVAKRGLSEGTTGTAFVIGNGTEDSASNAFRVTYEGKPYSCSSMTTSGADYAEFFEWLDLNPNVEDRRGYFVTLDEDKIKIAEPNDYILGIVSALPAVIGNGDECWRGRYILDDFGAFIIEEFEYEEKIFDKESGETKTITKTGTKYKENPDYDPTAIYIQREDRPEWDTVGMMGVLAVRDDGTCEVNGYCNVANGGIATASETGYRVIKRVSNNVIKVVFR